MKDVILRVIQSWLKNALRGACAAGDLDGADPEQHPAGRGGERWVWDGVQMPGEPRGPECKGGLSGCGSLRRELGRECLTGTPYGKARVQSF